MPEEKPKADRKKSNTIGSVLMLSAWGIAMVVSSFLFLYIGYLVDEILGTTPSFMLSSFFLAICLCIWRLYQEAKQKGKFL